MTIMSWSQRAGSRISWSGISILCLLGIVLYRSHGSHASHGSHRSSSGSVTVPRSSNSTAPTNSLPSLRKPSPTQKVPQIQIMKAQAYLSGLNLYRGAVDGVDGPPY